MEGEAEEKKKWVGVLSVSKSNPEVSENLFPNCIQL